MFIRVNFSSSTGTNTSHRTSLDPIQSQSRVPGHLLTNSGILDNSQLAHLPSSPYYRTFKGEWFALPAVSLEAKNYRFYSFINEWSRIAGPGSHPFKGNPLETSRTRGLSIDGTIDRTSAFRFFLSLFLLSLFTPFIFHLLTFFTFSFQCINGSN